MKKCFYCGASVVATRIGDGRKRCLKCGQTWFDDRMENILHDWACPASVDDLQWLWERCPAPEEMP